VGEKRLLTESERKALRTAAYQVAEGDTNVGKARARQEQLWRKLIQAGVTKSAIARESGLSQTGLNSRLATGERA
jgi:hypothetical protein